MLKDIKNMSDVEVISLVLNENKDYFEELIDRYKSLVFAIVSRMVTDREDVTDLSQEIFIKIYKNLDKYNSDFKFSTWTISIATNHIIDFRRKKRVPQVALTENYFNIEDPTTPLNEVIEGEKNEKVYSIIHQLPKIYGQVLFLYHLRGFSYQEIADEIEVPLSKVKNRLSRGRKLLKQSIQTSGELEIYEL